MIISMAPYRVSFAGGGSDIGGFYRHARGAVLSATVNKYVYISIHPYFNRSETLLKYSQNELVRELDQIKHPIFREALRDIWPKMGLEIVSTADVPSGTGLGSSSTFTVALIHALYAYAGAHCSKERLARKACELEIERCAEPIGKQDQYAAAYGGLNFLEFNADETVQVTPVILPKETISHLESSLLLFYTGSQRDTRTILTDQQAQVMMDAEKHRNLSRMVELAHAMRDALIAGDTTRFAALLHQGWVLKQTLSSRITNPGINRLYERALEHGALGGKLLGAGGGGFLLLYCDADRQGRLREAMAECHELPFRFDWGGARIIYVGERHAEEGFLSQKTPQ